MKKIKKGGLDIDALVKILLAVLVIAVIAVFVLYGKNLMVTLANSVYEPAKKSIAEAFKKLLSIK